MDWMLLQTAVAASLILPLIVYTWQRPDKSGLSRMLTSLLSLILLWAIGMAIGDRPGVPPAVTLALTVPSACFMSPLFLLLMLRYGRMGPFLDRPKTEWAVLAPFAVYMVIFVTNDLHGLMRDPYSGLTGGGAVATGTPLFWAFQVTSVGTACAGLAVCGRLAWASRSPAIRRTTALLGAATGLPLLTHLVWIFQLTPLEVPLTPAALAVTSCLIVMAIMRYEFLDVQPIARRDVIEASNIAVLIADIDRIVVDVNPAAARMLGLERSAILGQALGDVAASFGRTHPKDAMGVLLEDLDMNRAVEHIEFETPDGRTLEASIGRPIDRDGAHAGYFLVVDDRSSERQAQQLLYQSQKLESIGILAAGVAHEINNPLAFVRANFEHLGQLSMSVEAALDRLPKDLAEQLEEVPNIVDESLAGLDRIQGVVQGLLGFSRMPTEEASDVACNAVVGDAIRFASLGPNARLEIERRLAPDLPAICGVRAQLVQVLLNLLLNAKKSLADRPDPRIMVSTRFEQGRIEVCVEDNGPGVPEEIRSRIFDPFFTTREPNQGTGLGLAIALDIVRDHKGELVHETPVGGGARFIVKLPVSAPVE
jgi:PAS domain S-box-containing protein